MRRVLGLVVVVVLLVVAPAAASSWPQAGGNASRSGTQGIHTGVPPAAQEWSRAETDIRTPIVVTDGDGADTQRVAYGTRDGTVHLAVLASGRTVGPPEGTSVVNATVDTDVTDTFGSGQTSLGFADASTETRLGVIYVVHNDGQGVEIARIDAQTGERIDNVDTAVGSSLGCTANGSPVLTPPAAGGSRILFVALRGSCAADQAIVRIPIEGDATSRAATFGTQTFARARGIAPGVSPSLVVLRDPAGAPRFHVAIGREAGVDFYDAGRELDSSPGPIPPAPDHTLALPADETALTVSAPAAESGLVAGGEGSGVPGAPAMYVAAATAGSTKVYRLAQSGSAIVATGSTGVIRETGLPAPALAVAETVTPGGLSGSGRLVVTSADRLVLVRTSDLAILNAIPKAGPGRGFARTTAAAAGGVAFVTTDGAADVPPRQIALRLDDGATLDGDAFPAFANGPGGATGQPAIARGRIVVGTPTGAYGYRMKDPPSSTEPPLAPPVPCTTTLRGTPRADRLVGGSGDERLLGGGGRDRLLGRGGDDCISGGGGADRIDVGGGRNRASGGKGADVVAAVNRQRDVIACGRGRDRVRADRKDKVARDCERVRRVRR